MTTFSFNSKLAFALFSFVLCACNADATPKYPDQAPVLLLHGFDSSSLEFRRLWPILEESLETWAVDLVGWGFSDSGAARHKAAMKLGPKQKRDHLYAFWQQKVGARSHAWVTEQSHWLFCTVPNLHVDKLCCITHHLNTDKAANESHNMSTPCWSCLYRQQDVKS